MCLFCGHLVVQAVSSERDPGASTLWVHLFCDCFFTNHRTGSHRGRGARTFLRALARAELDNMNTLKSYADSQFFTRFFMQFLAGGEIADQAVKDMVDRYKVDGGQQKNNLIPIPYTPARAAPGWVQQYPYQRTATERTTMRGYTAEELRALPPLAQRGPAHAKRRPRPVHAKLPDVMRAQESGVKRTALRIMPRLPLPAVGPSVITGGASNTISGCTQPTQHRLATPEDGVGPAETSATDKDAARTSNIRHNATQRFTGQMKGKGRETYDDRSDGALLEERHRRAKEGWRARMLWVKSQAESNVLPLPLSQAAVLPAVRIGERTALSQTSEVESGTFERDRHHDDESSSTALRRSGSTSTDGPDLAPAGSNSRARSPIDQLEHTDLSTASAPIGSDQPTGDAHSPVPGTATSLRGKEEKSVAPASDSAESMTIRQHEHGPRSLPDAQKAAACTPTVLDSSDGSDAK